MVEFLEWGSLTEPADILLQINVYDLVLNNKESVRDLTQWMVQERLVSFIGSDMHGTREGRAFRNG